MCLQLTTGCLALQAAPLTVEEAPRDTAADSFVAAQLQRASISGREAEGMLLGEGGLDSAAAEQLRRDMEERVARASEGGMEPQQLEGYGQEVGPRPLVCRPNAAGDVTAVPVAVVGDLPACSLSEVPISVGCLRLSGCSGGVTAEGVQAGCGQGVMAPLGAQAAGMHRYGRQQLAEHGQQVEHKRCTYAAVAHAAVACLLEKKHADGMAG